MSDVVYAITKDHPRVGSSGLLIEDGKLLMGLSKKWDRWVIPGGGVDHMESYKDTVVREWREETGLTIEWQNLVDVFEILYEPTKDHRILIYSNVKRVAGDLAPGDDIAELRFFSRAELATLAAEDKLTGVMHHVLGKLGWLEASEAADNNVWLSVKS